MLRQSVPRGDDRGVLRRSRLGGLVPGRRAPEHRLRQHETGCGQDPGRRSKEAYGRLVRHSRRLIFQLSGGVGSSTVVRGSVGSYRAVITGTKLREGITTILPRGRVLEGVGLSSMRFHPTGRGTRTMKTNKKGALRLQTHLLSDRPAIDWPCRTLTMMLPSRFGLPFEPEDSQFGKSRLRRYIWIDTFANMDIVWTYSLNILGWYIRGSGVTLRCEHPRNGCIDTSNRNSYHFQNHHA